MIRSALILLALPLAACSGGDDKDGTAISFNAQGKDGTVTASTSADGRVQVKAPGFEGSIRLPKLKLDADNFEMNGVHLYPGSTISGINVNAQDKAGNGDGNANVDVRFESPAGAATVRDWFRSKLTDAGYTLEAKGNALTGTTEEGDPFKLEMADAGAGKATGHITIQDNK